MEVDTMGRRLRTGLLAIGLLLLFPGRSLAGRNEGGTLILHASPSLAYTSDMQSYCRQVSLSACSLAVTSVGWDPGRIVVLHALAAFPPQSPPWLKGLLFGIAYDPARFHLQAQGTCADFEVKGAGWPAPGTGTELGWNTTQTDKLKEVYWFAGYVYSKTVPDTASFALVPHPRQGGVFVDSEEPAALDTIVAYGRLGFARPGYAPCPQPLPVGACCRPNGICDIMTPLLCQQHGCSFHGAGTSCIPNLCPYPQHPEEVPR
jgi:hypothetical protein